ncbi:Protein lifeguard 1 [Nymphon striatum]|nr:Protein lifeguard 1 [Nymphon striatum]
MENQPITGSSFSSTTTEMKQIPNRPVGNPYFRPPDCIDTEVAPTMTYDCELCPQKFSTSQGRASHKRACKKKKNNIIKDNKSVPDNFTSENLMIIKENTTFENVQFPSLDKKIKNSTVDYDKIYLKNQITQAYEKIVFWRKNQFELPKGKVGETFVKLITDWINKWIDKTEYRDVAFHAVFALPSLLLQRSNNKSTKQQNKEVLSRRLQMWQEGKILDLLKECQVIQNRLENQYKNQHEDLPKRFKNLVFNGNVKGALRLLEFNAPIGILTVNEKTKNLLHKKHPPASPISPELLLTQPVYPDREYDPIIFDEITPDLVQRLTIKSKGSGGPSLFNANDWRRMIGTKLFGDEGTDLCRTIANLAKILCTEKISDPNSISPLMACRLIPLDKNPGLRPIGIGEVLRRIIGKCVTFILKKDLQTTAGGLQLCVGQEGGAEAAIHGMRDIFQDDETEGLIQVDADNAFNTINRSVLLHNINFLCPEISIYVHNCYIKPSRLFVTGGMEITSSEGTTQGDPIAMPLYAIGILPLMGQIQNIVKEQDQLIKQVAFADDLTGAGKLKALKTWWEAILEFGPYIGYYAKPSKSWLIVKEQHIKDAKDIFKDLKLNITAEGRKHLGATIGSNNFKETYVSTAVKEWIDEMSTLTQISHTEPHAAYSAFTHGFKHKFTYLMRTIPNIEQYLKPLDAAIDKFIKSLFGNHEINENERMLLSLPVKAGGLGLIIPSELSTHYYQNSRYITESLTNHVKEQLIVLNLNKEDINARKHKVKLDKIEREKYNLQTIEGSLNAEQKRLLECISEKGASSWLNALPLQKYNFHLDKQSFRDAIHLRYGKMLAKLPLTCVCGASYNINHSLSCHRGGFIIARHNDIRNLTGELLDLVCNDVELEPTLNNVTGESFKKKTANKKDDARADVSARGFWVKGRKTFVDIRVFNPLAKMYNKNVNTTLKSAYQINENSKKREYNERILQIEHGTFTPLVFSAFGGMGYEANRFFKRLNEMIAEKKNENTSVTMSYIRTKLSFSLLRSTLLCVRGSRSVKLKHHSLDIKDVDFKVAAVEAVYFILTCQLLVTVGFICLFIFNENVKRYVQSNLALYIAAYDSDNSDVDYEPMESDNETIDSYESDDVDLSEHEDVEESYHKTEIVLFAMGICAACCLCVTIFAIQTKFDFTKWGGVLFVVFLVVFFFGIIAIIMRHKIMTIIYSALIALVFMAFLAYDTQLVIGGSNRKYSLGPEEYINGALQLYMDIVQIFLAILSLTSSSSS